MSVPAQNASAGGPLSGPRENGGLDEVAWEKENEGKMIKGRL